MDYFMAFLIHGSIFYMLYCSIFYPRMIYYYNPNEAYYRLGEYLYNKDNKFQWWKDENDEHFLKVHLKTKTFFLLYKKPLTTSLKKIATNFS